MSKLLESLHQLLPSSRRIATPFFLTADSVIHSLGTAKIPIPMQRIADFETADWDDLELGQIIFRDHWAFHSGHVFIHAPACSRYSLPDFECDSKRLSEFIRDYEVEMLFSCDVLFLAPESKTITVFHHEGAFGHAKLPAVIP